MTPDCLFCGIAAGTVPAKKIFEDERVVAFHDIRPAAPVHVLLIPRRHVISVADLLPADEPLVGELIRRAKTLAEELGIAPKGYRLVFNVRRDAGQAVDHLHLHLIGGRQLGHLA